MSCRMDGLDRLSLDNRPARVAEMRATNLAGRSENRTQTAFGAYVQGLIGAVALGSLASSGGGRRSRRWPPRRRELR